MIGSVTCRSAAKRRADWNIRPVAMVISIPAARAAAIAPRTRGVMPKSPLTSVPSRSMAMMRMLVASGTATRLRARRATAIYSQPMPYGLSHVLGPSQNERTQPVNLGTVPELKGF